MAIVQKENRVLRVHDDIVGSYLSEGYDQINEQGDVIKKATGGRSVSLAEYNKVIDDLGVATEKINEQKEEIKVLEEENIRLDKLLKQAGHNNNRK